MVILRSCLQRRFLFAFLGAAIFLATGNGFSAQEIPFPVSARLAGAVEFWKQIFTHFGANEAVFFDPLDPQKIYSVLRAPETDEGRAMIEKERRRIIADYDLNEEEGRVRSQRGVQERFLSGLRISGRYTTQMQKIFRAEGLPAELAFLPLVESSFNVRARSTVGAVGIWQFMPDTGKKFLRIDDTVDERKDPLASTRAAARLLRENYKLFGNWPLAITAYNHGTEGIFRGMNATGSQNLEDLIGRYQSPTFGFASKNFYAEFLAAAEIAKDSEAYFPFLRSLRPLTFREVEIKRSVQIQALLRSAAIKQNDFLDWNPALSPRTKYLPAGYSVKVPEDKVDSFLTVHRRLADTPEPKSVASVTKRRSAGLESQQKADVRKTGLQRKGSKRRAVKGMPKPIRSAGRGVVAATG